MDSLETLKKDEDTGKVTVPKSRIGNASNARDIVNKLKSAELTRSLRRTKQQGMLDGNPPIPPQKLKDAGRGDEPNINLREAEGVLDAAKTPYYGLIFDSAQFAQIDFRYGTDPIRNAQWSQILAEEYHNMLDAWDGFDYNIQLHQWEMCYYGVGPIYWQDETDWRFQSLKIGKLLVPDKSKADIDRIELCAIPHSYLVHELYKSIENEEAALAAKWNVKAVKNAIMNASEESLGGTMGEQSWERAQASIRQGDYWWSLSQSKTVQVLHLLVKEFNGKISHYIVNDEEGNSGSTIGQGKDEFLFEKRDRFDSFSQVICPYFFDIGTGDWHSIKGLGPKIFDFCAVSNLLTMRMLGGAMLASGVTLKATNANATQKAQIVNIGAASLLPVDWEAQQTRIAENLQGPLAIKRDLQGTLQSNIGSYRQRVSEENQEPTLGQAQMNATQQATLGQGSVNRYCKTGDRMHREIIRRALNPKLSKADPGGEQALEMRQKCIERGIPEEGLIFSNIKRVRMTRNIGNGSAQIRQMTAQALVGMLATMNETGRNFALRTWAAALPGGGQQLADALYPAITEADVPNDQVWAAQIENGLLREPGKPPVITPKQDHAIHFTEHMKDVQEHMQQAQQGQSDPIKLLVHMEQAGPHTHQHLQAMQGDPTRKTQVEGFQKAWLGMSKMADKLKQQVAEMQKAAEKQQAEQQPASDPKLVTGLAKVHADTIVKHEKMTMDEALKREKFEHQKKLSDAKTAHGIQIENAKAESEMART